MRVTLGSNIAGARAARQLDDSSQALARSFERLSSGLRINRASDDAAGLAISTSLSVDARVSDQGVRNTNDARSLLDVADGATSALKEVITRLRELATQASNGTAGDARRASLNQEAQVLRAEYNRVLSVTGVNGLAPFRRIDDIQIQAGYSSVAMNLSQTVSVGDGTFRPQASFSAGIGPKGVTAADLNGDGILDLATADSTNSGVSVYLGIGDGTFQFVSTFRGGVNPYSLSATDLNGDGAIDLLTADYTGGSASVLLGNGNGTFKLGVTFLTDAQPTSVTVGDFNCDGVPDAAVTTGAGLNVLLGNRDGTLGPKTRFTMGVGPISVATADLNADGFLDVVTADRDGDTLSVRLGNGNGTFQARTSMATGSTPRSVAVADFDGDGVPDLVVANLGDASVSVRRGNGDGSFKAATSFVTGTSPFAVSAGDLNGDHLPDLIVADYGSGTTSVLLGNGDGSFRARTSYATGGAVTATFVADLDRDGAADIVATDLSNSRAMVLLGNAVSVRTPVLQPLTQFSIGSLGAARAAQGQLDTLRDDASRFTGVVGSWQRRLGHVADSLSLAATNYREASDRITDVDTAEETACLVRNRILQQSQASILAQANLAPQLVLKLLSDITPK